MAKAWGEDGNARRTEAAYERLRDKVRALSPEAVERANRFVIRNELWVHKYARDFIHENHNRIRGIPEDDIHQAAFLGCVIASYSWTPAKGAHTYWAWYWMRKEMQKLIGQRGPGMYHLFEDRRGNAELESPHPSGAVEAEALEYLGRLREIAEAFPRPYRVAIDDWAEGVKVAETAGRLGITRRGVLNHRTVALEWLRYRMGEGPEPGRPLIGGAIEPVVQIERGHDHGGGAQAESPRVGGVFPLDQSIFG